MKASRCTVRLERFLDSGESNNLLIPLEVSLFSTSLVRWNTVIPHQVLPNLSLTQQPLSSSFLLLLVISDATSMTAFCSTAVSIGTRGRVGSVLRFLKSPKRGDEYYALPWRRNRECGKPNKPGRTSLIWSGKTGFVPLRGHAAMKQLPGVFARVLPSPSLHLLEWE